MVKINFSLQSMKIYSALQQYNNNYYLTDTVLCGTSIKST